MGRYTKPLGVLIVLFFFPFLTQASSDHVSLGAGCFPDDTNVDTKCPYEEELGATEVLLKWKVPELSSDNKVCWLLCTAADKTSCGYFFKVDKNNFASSTGREIKSEDNVLVRPRVGNTYQAVCLGNKKDYLSLKGLPSTILGNIQNSMFTASQSKVTLAKLGEVTLANSPKMEIIEPKLKVRILNGLDFYQGEKVKIGWEISDPVCKDDIFKIKAWVDEEGVNTSTYGYSIGRIGLNGTYEIDTSPQRTGFRYFVNAVIVSGKCAGVVSSPVFYNVLRPSLSLTEPNGGIFYNGDKLTISWTGEPSLPNNTPVNITLVNENRTFGVEMVGVGPATLMERLIFNNNGYYEVLVPNGSVKRNSVIHLCYFLADYDNPPNEMEPDDWTDFGMPRYSICVKSPVFQFGGERPKSSLLNSSKSWLANVISSFF